MLSKIRSAITFASPARAVSSALLFATMLFATLTGCEHTKVGPNRYRWDGAETTQPLPSDITGGDPRYSTEYSASQHRRVPRQLDSHQDTVYLCMRLVQDYTRNIHDLFYLQKRQHDGGISFGVMGSLLEHPSVHFEHLEGLIPRQGTVQDSSLTQTGITTVIEGGGDTLTEVPRNYTNPITSPRYEEQEQDWKQVLCHLDVDKLDTKSYELKKAMEQLLFYNGIVPSATVHVRNRQTTGSFYKQDNTGLLLIEDSVEVGNDYTIDIDGQPFTYRGYNAEGPLADYLWGQLQQLHENRRYTDVEADIIKQSFYEILYSGDRGRIDSLLSNQFSPNRRSNLLNYMNSNSNSQEGSALIAVDSLFITEKEFSYQGNALDILTDPFHQRMNIVDSLGDKAEKMQASAHNIQIVDSVISGIYDCQCPVRIEVTVCPSSQILNSHTRSDSVKTKVVFSWEFDPTVDGMTDELRKLTIDKGVQARKTFYHDRNNTHKYDGQTYRISTEPGRPVTLKDSDYAGPAVIYSNPRVDGKYMKK